jgi:DNA-binding FrmR family transcriptional regulator
MATINNPADRQSLTLRLNRAEGQIRGVKKMIDAGAQCEDISQQLTAARKALDRVFHQMIDMLVKQELGSVKEQGSKDRLSQIGELLARFS